MRWQLRVGVGVLALGCRGGYREPSVRMYVDRITPADHGELVRAVGIIEDPVHAGSRDSPTVTFTLVYGSTRVRVVHRGILPDRFGPGSTGAVDGWWIDAARVTAVLAATGYRRVTFGDVLVLSSVRFGTTESSDVIVSQQVLVYGRY